MLWIDLEGTVIDDLENRNWLNGNVRKIKQFINENCAEINGIGILTFGWLNKNEIDDELVKMVGEKLGYNIGGVLVKEDFMAAARERTLWNYPMDLPLDVSAEVSFSEKFSKVDIVARLFSAVGGATNILIDDCVEKSVRMTFQPFKQGHDMESIVELINPRDL